MTLTHLEVADLIDRPVRDAITVRGKELAAGATVAAARALFASSSVQVIPVVEDSAYLGAVLREDLPSEAGDDEPIAGYATGRPPTAIASSRLSDALPALELDGGRRLVVLADDNTTYLGLVCLRSDRQQVCVDAECHAGPGVGAAASLPAISANAQVADLVIADPSRARVFEKLGIDYCCGGNVPLADAAEALGLKPDDVIALLEEPRDRGAEDVDWTAEPLTVLVRHIIDTHHAYLHEELEPLGALVAKVARAHGDAHPALHDVEATYNGLAAELVEHLAEEETVVFPACLATDEAGDRSAIGEPIAEMLRDHDAVGAALLTLRTLTHGYQAPVDACNSYRAMLDRLATLEADVHRHVHEENNILVPRVLELAR
jgi:regulator of cell morphogenesis and NO signaling